MPHIRSFRGAIASALALYGLPCFASEDQAIAHELEVTPIASMSHPLTGSEHAFGPRASIPLSAGFMTRAETQTTSSALAKGISQAAQVGLLARGTEVARQAVQECLKGGEYPEGGMGELSFAAGRPSAIADHCRR